jgi:hypothetical protein
MSEAPVVTEPIGYDIDMFDYLMTELARRRSRFTSPAHAQSILEVGYIKARSVISRMEERGLIGPLSAVKFGRHELLFSSQEASGRIADLRAEVGRG